MKKPGQRLFLPAVFLGVMALLIPTFSAAFETIKLGEETEVTFYGWLRNNSGIFTSNPQPFSQSSNVLATERTWLRAYTDFKITNELRFWSAIQFAWEPWYPVEKGSLDSRLLYGGPTLKNGKEYSEYKDPDDILREFYLRWDPSKENSIKIGRQIAIWGEALTTRVGDVIHPEDQRYSLAFANLEDTRIPSWMVRGTHSIPNINSSFEWIVNPNIVEDKYRVNRLASIADNTVNGEPGQRFGIYPETRFRAPYSVTNPLLGPPFSIPGVVVTNPFSRDWIQAFPGFWVPTAIPTVNFKFPGAWDGIRGGFRTNTTLSGWNFGLTYFHTQEYNPVVKRGDLTGGVDATTGLPLRQYTVTYPNKDIIGAYLNKQLPWPGVLRAEVIYVPNQPFNTFNPTDSDGVVRRDYLKYMIAYDLNSFLYFQWHKTAPFDITFEHVGEIIPNPENLQYIIYDTKLQTWNPSFNMRIYTTWLYKLIETELVVSYMPWGHSGLVMPSIKYNPPWFNQKLQFELRYNYVFAGSNYKGLGILNKKDMVVFTSQFNW